METNNLLEEACLAMEDSIRSDIKSGLKKSKEGQCEINNTAHPGFEKALIRVMNQLETANEKLVAYSVVSGYRVCALRKDHLLYPK